MTWEVFTGRYGRGRKKSKLTLLKVGEIIFLKEKYSCKLKSRVKALERRHKMRFEWEDAEDGINIRRSE
jgi:hypothetical protein